MFEAPRQTLFVLEAGQLRLFTGDGGEALLLVGDFVALLLHLSVHPVASLARFQPELLRGLAAALREGHPHGQA